MRRPTRPGPSRRSPLCSARYGFVSVCVLCCGVLCYAVLCRMASCGVVQAMAHGRACVWVGGWEGGSVGGWEGG